MTQQSRDKMANSEQGSSILHHLVCNKNEIEKGRDETCKAYTNVFL